MSEQVNELKKSREPLLQSMNKRDLRESPKPFSSVVGSYFLCGSGFVSMAAFCYSCLAALFQYHNVIFSPVPC
ncbi:hypothetical protein AVEN_87413-1 [Araneus ventricosus]|uniref:Uncharacterized protein n=1 Tax=Araneus ventricosus TaxID=182803 RepID=A0A4Y2MKA7_ARAVE|nr:hypothetical protein AVEN_87413-1 [Araneus ventricosus]